MKESLVGTIFYGKDGRIHLHPFGAIRGIPVTSAQAERMVEAFKATGWSKHSKEGLTRWVITHYCEVNGLAYEVREGCIKLLET